MSWRALGNGVRFDRHRKIAEITVFKPGSKARTRKCRQYPAENVDEARETGAALRRQFLAEFRGDAPPKDLTPPKPEVATPVAEPRVPTFSEFAHGEFQRVIARRQDSTRDFYRHVINVVSPMIGSLPIDAIEKRHIDDLITELVARKKSPTTANGYAKAVLRILRGAVDRGIIKSFPIHGKVDFEDEVLPELELTPEEQSRLLDAFNIDPETFFTYIKNAPERRVRERLRPHLGNYALYKAVGSVVVLALQTGLRKGDLLALLWSEIDMDAGWIEVRTAKTGQKVSIPISNPCREALNELGKRKAESGLVCVTPVGEPISKGIIQDFFGLAKRLAGFPKSRRFRFHDLRHTYATNLATAGVPLHIVQKALAHTTVAMTQRYARTRDEAMESVRAALNLSPNSPKSSRSPG